MNALQEQEVLNYFSRSAAEWREAPPSVSQNNSEKQRRKYIRQVVMAKDQVSRALEVGAGDGQVLLDLTRSGVKAVGVNLNPDRLTAWHHKAEIAGAELVYSSVLDYRPLGISFDLISTNRFVEHISGGELAEFVRHARELMAPDGSLLLKCRNRLYNAFALNGGTRLELSKGVVHRLIVESMIFSTTETIAEVIEELLYTRDLLPPIDRRIPGDIGAADEGRYTPGQVVRLLADFGFETVDLFPLDYCSAVPRFVDEHAAAHAEIADIVNKCAHSCHYLTPFATSFIVHALRT